MSDETANRGRRRFLGLMLAAPLVLAPGSALWPKVLEARRLAPTPECEDDDDPTPALTEGPFFKPRSPLRTSLLESGIRGTKLVLTGRVFARDCRPLTGALIDFWHADGDGEYDNEGFRLRGHQFTDKTGAYRLETILPGEYPGRTRHFHVKVQAPKGRILTTQLFFPGETRNRRDGIFRSDLVVKMGEQDGVRRAGFHFVLDQG